MTVGQPQQQKATLSALDCESGNYLKLPLNEDVFIVNYFSQQFDFAANLFGTGTWSLLVMQMTAGGARRFADASDGIDGWTAS